MGIHCLSRCGAPHTPFPKPVVGSGTWRDTHQPPQQRHFLVSDSVCCSLDVLLSSAAGQMDVL